MKNPQIYEAIREKIKDKGIKRFFFNDNIATRILNDLAKAIAEAMPEIGDMKDFERLTKYRQGCLVGWNAFYDKLLTNLQKEKK